MRTWTGPPSGGDWRPPRETFPRTGVGGLTLGTWAGWPGVSGLACDNVVLAEIVAAEGATLRVSESEHEDLFWGLRGGGGNFGVVTEFGFRLHEIGTAALIIDYTFDIGRAGSAMRRWRDLLSNGVRHRRRHLPGSGRCPTPRTCNTETVRWRASASSGSAIRTRVGGWCRWWPASAPRWPSGFKGCPTCLQSMDDEWHRPGTRRRYFKGHYLSELSDEAIDAFLSQGADPSGHRTR